MRCRRLAWLLLSPALALATELPWEDLPPAPGRELTYGVCSACHSMDIVKQQGMTREQWDETLAWMVEEQGMGELSGDTRELVLDYLAAVYSPDRPYFNQPE